MPEVKTCDVKRVPAVGVLPFLLALVLAVPVAYGAGTVTLDRVVRASDVAAVEPAAAPFIGPVAPVAPVAEPTSAQPVAAPTVTAAPQPAATAEPTVGPVAAETTSGSSESAATVHATPAPEVFPTPVNSPEGAAAPRVRWLGDWTRTTQPATNSALTRAASPEPTSTTSPAALPATPEGVINPAGVSSLTGWQADSAAGPVAMSRVSASGPFAYTTAVQLTRAGGSGDWARALAAISSPATFFTPGKSYQMSAWVRDLKASGKSVGLLIADGAYASRPTEASAYESYTDTEWHRITRVFTATSRASADTGVYLALPESGPLSVQVTGVSVREVLDTAPAAVTAAPIRTVSFAGAAGTAPNAAQWNFETGGGGWGNGELQTYTNRTSNAQVDGAGNLVITARRETYAADDGITRRYTSARLSTEGKVVIQPGSYVEAKITAPVGDSVWPAFWLIGANIRQVGWPASGELDVLEGAGANATKAYNAAHMAKIGDPRTDMPYGWGDGGTVDLGAPLDRAPHLYGVYFDGNVVRFFIDRREVRSISAAAATASGRNWPFGKPQYVVLNVAVDGDGGDPVGTSFPRSMVVGGISVWDGVPF